MKKSKKQNTKMSFLTHRKNINDMFFDVLKVKTKRVPERFKNGNVKKNKFKIQGITQLAKELKVTPTQIRNYIKKGSVNDNLYHFTRNVEIQHKKLKIPRTKKETKQFTVHTFTFANFFAKKNFKVKKNVVQLFFRCGLYIEFAKMDKYDNILNDKTVYTIQNLPISHYSNLYPQGYKEFFEIIKQKLMDYPSIKFFRFNYFDVQKINMGSIENSKIKTKKLKRKK
jgi:hypothetical protein